MDVERLQGVSSVIGWGTTSLYRGIGEAYGAGVE